MFLRQSTASQEITLGRFVDSVDGDSEETGLTIANTDIKLWKEGATALVSKNAGGATHMANGLYYCVLDATDTATLGNLEVHVHVAGALAVQRSFVVLAANVYDSLVAASSNLLVTLANGAHGGTGTTIRLGGSSATPALYITNSGGDAVQFESTGGNGLGLELVGQGNGMAFRCTAGATADAVSLVGGGTSGAALSLSTTSGNTIAMVPGGTGAGILIQPAGGHCLNLNASGTTVGSAIRAAAGTTANAITIIAGTTNGDAIDISSTNGHGFDLSGVAGALKVAINGTLTANPAAGGIVAASFGAGAINAAAVAADATAAIADALLDRTAGVETNRTLRGAMRLILAVAVGKLNGAQSNNLTIRDTNDTKNRVAATVDAYGNRGAVTLDDT